MPFSRDAIDRSVTKLEKDGADISDLTGYEQWRADCGGVYNPVVDIVPTVLFPPPMPSTNQVTLEV